MVAAAAAVGNSSIKRYIVHNQAVVGVGMARPRTMPYCDRSDNNGTLISMAKGLEVALQWDCPIVGLQMFILIWHTD